MTYLNIYGFEIKAFQIYHFKIQIQIQISKNAIKRILFNNDLVYVSERLYTFGEIFKYFVSSRYLH